MSRYFNNIPSATIEWTILGKFHITIQENHFWRNYSVPLESLKMKTKSRDGTTIWEALFTRLSDEELRHVVLRANAMLHLRIAMREEQLRQEYIQWDMTTEVLN